MPVSHKKKLPDIYNTFGLPCQASQLFLCANNSEVKDALRNAEHTPIVIGEGSNLILPALLERTVIQLTSSKIVVLETGDYYTVEVDAGMNWDSFVEYLLSRDIRGLENLAAIPGTCGAAPVQNIGAYGVEISDFIQEVKGVYVDTYRVAGLCKEACQFGYRDSIFKQALMDKFVITSLVLEIPKNWQPKLSYSNLSNYLSESSSATEIYKKITDIRWSKLPKPNKLGNAGSFFKNPVIQKELATTIMKQHPNIVTYSAGSNNIKFAAGWLIEQCGFKGLKESAVGMYEKQALVMVNINGCELEDVIDLVKEIKCAVFDKFRIHLEVEPRILQ